MVEQKRVLQVEWLVVQQIAGIVFVVETVSNGISDIEPTVLSVESLVALLPQLENVIRVNAVPRPVFVELNVSEAVLKHNNVSAVNETVAQQIELWFACHSPQTIHKVRAVDLRHWFLY
jgi:hypothetical protein